MSQQSHIVRTDATVKARAVWRYLQPPTDQRSAAARRAYNPELAGVLPADLAAVLTWVPPAPARLEKVNILSAPPGTHVLALTVGGEETVDPQLPLPWEVFLPQHFRGEIGLIVLPTQSVVLRLQRPATM